MPGAQSPFEIRWKSASRVAGELSGAMTVCRSLARHKKSVLISIGFKRPATGVKLIDELAEFEINANEIVCRVATGLSHVYLWRLQAVLKIIGRYLGENREGGHFSVSLGDEGLLERVIAFSSVVPDYLVPDPSFIQSHGYSEQRQTYLNAVPWDHRKDILYWRGTDTGVWRYAEVGRSPRVRACLLAHEHRSLLSAAITNMEDRDNEGLKKYYLKHGIMGVHESQDEILQYKYQLDIDGNTSAWSGLFLKLLTGAPVLKVVSEWNWRQWYYSDLISGEHYVPVKPDLSDLIEKLIWLRQNQAKAKAIGVAGRNLALSLTYKTQMLKATETLERLIQLERIKNNGTVSR